MSLKKKLITGTLLFSSVLALVACGGQKEAEKTETEAKTEMTETAEKTETAMAALKDGTYTGESAFDEHGFKVVHSITVKDGKITESAFGYEDEKGMLKADNEEYNTNMKAKSGVSSKEATDKLNADLIEAQNASDVEVVTGATHTSENFKMATEALLKAAEEGNTEKVTFEFGK